MIRRLFSRSPAEERCRELEAELRGMKKRVENRSRLEEIVRVITARFINLPTVEYDTGIYELIKDIGTYSSVDRSYLFIVSDDGKYLTNTHEWCARGIEPQIQILQDLPADTFPWWMSKFRDAEVMHIPRVEDLPEEAAAERRILAEQDIKSLLAVPLMEKDRLTGFIGFDSVRSCKNWENEEIYLLRSVAQDIVNLRLRKAVEDELRGSRKNFSQLVTSIGSAFFLFSLDLSRTVYASPSYPRIWERSGESIESEPLSWLDAVHPDERYRIESAFRKFPGSGNSFSSEFRILTRGGTKWIAFRAFEVAADHEAGRRIAAIAEDVTEKKTAEIELVQLRESELVTSARIQRSILIEEPEIHIPGVSISALSIPSQEVDGDFFNSVMFSEQVFDLLVGDVMGKGLPGAFLGAAVRNRFLRVKLEMVLRRSGYSLPEPEEVVNEVARRISPELIKLESFVTLTYVRFLINARRLDFVDCGNTPIVHFHGATERCWLVKGRNLPVGFIESERYEQSSIPLADGDILFFYSDGISEARNQQGDMFGEQRILSMVERHHEAAAGEIVGAVKNGVIDFCEGLSFADDFTCVAVKLAILQNSGMLRANRIFPGRSSSLREVRDFLQEFLLQAPIPALPQKEREKIILAGSEAAANVAEHGIRGRRGGRFYLELGAAPDWLFLRFTYPGKSFSWTDVREPVVEELNEGGYGMYLMDRIMDSVNYATDLRGGMMLTLIKRFDKNKLKS